MENTSEPAVVVVAAALEEDLIAQALCNEFSAEAYAFGDRRYVAVGGGIDLTSLARAALLAMGLNGSVNPIAGGRG